MENKEILKILEKAVKCFDEQKTLKGIEIVKKFYGELVSEEQKKIDADNRLYDLILKNLINGQKNFFRSNSALEQKRLRLVY